MEYFQGFPSDFDEIVGESQSLRRALDQAKKVAPSDATILILGETGTGKKLIARAIHRMSLRKDARFVQLDCSAAPVGLLENELFGRGKGYSSHATCQIAGGIESASGGTLFLDEIGDLPLALQPRLLRLLRTGEFEKQGSDCTIRADIRLLAASKRDLVRSVAQRKFLPELYYRLGVFPIRMPALCERVEDIPLLARYFAQKYGRKMNRQIETITVEGLHSLAHALANSPWPGNVRDLEKLIERLVILSEGPVLRIRLAELRVNPERGTFR
jgi:formate hydrogenlyase transcriptional activator